MSQSTQAVLPQLITSAKTFVNDLQVVHSLPVQISIELFGGEAALTEWQAPTLDTPTLLARLDALSSYQAADPASTNLYGAVIDGVSKLNAAQTAFRSRNHGGAFTTGYMILFTDGGDTAGLRTQSAAVSAVQLSGDEVLAVGLAGADYNAAALAALATSSVITTESPDELSREFGAQANRIAGQFSRTYLLAYCSPKRSGSHTVSVSVVNTSNAATATYTFSASGFGPGCNAQVITTACDGKACGGLGCGACDDRTSECSGSSWDQCVSFCATRNECSAVHTNPLGYSQECPDILTSTDCNGACSDLTTDEQHCGSCDRVCDICVAGNCFPDVEWAQWTLPPERPFAYTYDANTVTDTVTGLIWQRGESSATYTWANAKAYCSGLSLGSATWRLPTLIELESIVDGGTYSPAINTTVFPTPPREYFWSASPLAKDSSYAWSIHFYNGVPSLDDVGVSSNVRCVQ